MWQPLSVIAIGLLLGMRHATDADHVIAVAAIVSRERRIGAALRIGALWGVGHSLTILLVGGAILLFDLAIPPRLGLSMELSVALMLILLGVANLTGALRWMNERVSTDHAHVHEHAHDGEVHTHLHHHDRASGDHAELEHAAGRLAHLGWFHFLRPLVVGVVHGLAGSAAVALLVLATLPDPLWGMLYLVVFSFGTVAGMMAITAINALPFAFGAARWSQLDRYLGLASGVLSLGFGLFLAYQIGFVDGLFTANPQWIAS